MSQMTCIVTGASRGIGKAIALELGRGGAQVALAARTLDGSLQSIQAVAEQIRDMGGEAMAVRTDVTDPEAVARLAQRTLDRWGRIDVLVNNAGLIGPVATPLETSISLWRSILEVNLTGAFACCMAVLPQMVAQEQGCIVNISSGAAHQLGAINVAYGVSKAGLDKLTRDLAEALLPHKIAVVSVSPRFTDTEGVREIMPHRAYDEALAPEVTAQAVSRLIFGDPLQVTGKVLRPWEIA